MSEKHSETVFVIDGDIVNEDDYATITGADPRVVMPNAHRIARMGPRVVSPVDVMQELQATNDFTKRNEHLVKAAVYSGQANRATGAAHRLEAGVYVPRYKDANHALGLAAEHDNRAQAAIERACGSCALSAFCGGLDSGVLSDPEVRRRFASRVGKPGNNQLCEDNLRPGRLPKLV